MIILHSLEGIDEIQYLCVAPPTSVKMHGHDNQWEVWARIFHKTAHICLIGEEHELVNNSSTMMILMAIKGHVNYSYDDLAKLFYKWGFSVTHGSLVVDDKPILIAGNRKFGPKVAQYLTILCYQTLNRKNDETSTF